MLVQNDCGAVFNADTRCLYQSHFFSPRKMLFAGMGGSNQDNAKCLLVQILILDDYQKVERTLSSSKGPGSSYILQSFSSHVGSE